MRGAAVGGDPGAASARACTVVAVAVVWRGRVGLFRRSAQVSHDRGLWHCVTGYVEPDATPSQQAIIELHEETGLGVTDLDSFDEGEVLALTDAQGASWTVHTYRATTTRRRLVLNWEHDAHKWVEPRAVARFGNRVAWLWQVLEAVEVVPSTPRTVRTEGAAPPSALMTASETVVDPVTSEHHHRLDGRAIG